MLFWTIVKVGLKALMANKLRSLLAMLGIIIGVGAVIAMLAIGAGTRKQIVDRINSMGSNLLFLRPGQSHSGGVRSGTSQKLKLADAEAVTKIADVECVAPLVRGWVQVKCMSRNAGTTCTGVPPGYLKMRGFQVERGRCFNEIEADTNAHVVLLGPVAATNLFGEDDPIGQTVKLNGTNFEVIGILKAKGDQGWYNPDDQVHIPLHTAMKQVFGVIYVAEIDVQRIDGADLHKVQNDMDALMRRRHHIETGADADFEIRNQADFLELANESTKSMSIFLGAVAGISLLVGGIGIMNIMLVSVTERTREIGVRMAIGAKRSNILTQFMLEAMVVSGLGGLLGVAFGLVTSPAAGYLLSTLKIMDLTPQVEIWTVVVSFVFAVVVGLISGIYPAWRASRLDPVEALRYE